MEKVFKFKEYLKIIKKPNKVWEKTPGVFIGGPIIYPPRGYLEKIPPVIKGGKITTNQ